MLKLSRDVCAHGFLPKTAERTECRSYGLWMTIVGNALDIAVFSRKADIVKSLHGLGTENFLKLPCYTKGTPMLLFEVLLT